MNYTDLQARIEASAVIDSGTDDAWLPSILDGVIERAEARCYRDVDFLTARRSGASATVVATDTITAPQDWLLGQRVAITVLGSRIYLDRRDDGFLREYTSGAASGQPKYWAEPLQGTILLSPVPDAVYPVVLEYHARPAVISAMNATTWLATNAPDLLFSACMLEVAAYQKNFGAAADDPRAAMTWKAMYDAALASVLREEGRRKGDNTFDSSPAPPPTSNLPQGVPAAAQG